ncbi:MAG TPA: MATE family efflux transporter, partial [Opitutaceae bacterium]
MSTEAATLPRNLNRTIIRMALPAMGESVLLTFVLFVDTVLVGWLRDPAAIGAVALGGTFYFALQGVFVALGVGGTALTARAWGAGDRTAAGSATANAVGIGFVTAAVATALSFALVMPFLRAMGAGPDLASQGAVYMRILLVGAPVNLVMLVALACLRASGDTVTPLKISGLYNLLNLVLDFALIFGVGPIPAMGVAGAAWATSISGFIACGVTAWALLGKSSGLKVRAAEVARWNAGVARRIVKVSLPAFAEIVVQRAGYIVFMGLVTGLGTTALAAHAIGLRIESLSYGPGWGFSVAAAALVGQALGAGRPDDAERIGWRAALLGGAYMGACGMVFVAFGPWLVAPFLATPEVLDTAGLLVRIAAFAQPFMAVYFVMAGSHRGAGDTTPPLVVTLIGVIPLRLGLVWLFGIKLGGGIEGVWAACVVDWFA